jgi:CelD/BcsL family acetyltransferase involved in cellulose biosynthesis
MQAGRFDAMRRFGPEGERAIDAAAKYLIQLEGWDLLQLCNTPQRSTIERIVAAMRTKGIRSLRTNDQPNPIVVVPEDTAQLEAMPPNAKLRSQLRRVREKLALRGSLRFYRIANADSTALARFYELEASGWKGRAGSAILCKGTRAFYDEMAQQAARNGYFSLFMLECGAELVAAHYSFTHRDRCYSPIVTYNEAFRQFAPGHLIIAHILAYCASHGIRCFDITGQDQSWKMKWTSQTRGMHNYFLFKGPIGQLAYRVGMSLRTVTRLIHSAHDESLEMDVN